MNKLSVLIVVLYALSLFFIGMSIFADKSTTIGVVISLIGYGSLLIASCLSLLKLILQKKQK
jgi:hypothetical protein